ncbi:diguanylate cyclase domain-containing protein [Vreelandella sp. EE22]
MLWKLKPAMVIQDRRSIELLIDNVSLCDLEAAKVRLLYEKLWQPVISSLVAAAFMLLAIWSANTPLSLLSWLAALSVVSLLRLWLAYRFGHVASDPYHKKWLYAFAAGALASGAIWGAAGIIFFTPDYPEQFAALAVVMAGIAAGGITTLSSVKWIAVGFVTPILLPVAVLFVIQGSLLSSVVGGMMLIFLMLMLATSSRFNRIIHDNIALRVNIEAREAQLLESENRYRSIFDHSPLGVLHFDRNGIITDCNDQMLMILGGGRSAFIGYRMLDRAANQEVAQGVRDALEKGSGYFEGVFHLPGAKTGTPLRAIFNGVNSASKERIGGMAIVEDFTERTRNEAIIYRQAYYDSLTDLPNRRLFIERLMGLCDEPSRHERTGVVMFLDMDRFKLINDTFGHAAGDDLLVQIAERLERHLDDDDMAARLSGDEFVMLKLIDQPLSEAAERVAQSAMEMLQSTLTGQYCLEGQRVDVTPSMGYTCFSAARYDHADILKQADIAMYQAKADGRARLRRYRPEMQKVLAQGESCSSHATLLTAR